jgi:Lysozyme like domain
VGCTCVQSYEAPGNVKYTEAQIAGLWIQAGGNAQVANIMAAIAYIESGGNSTATCVNGGPGCSCNGCVDRGLFQIDSVHGAGSTYDVMGNVRAAVALYNSSGFQPWGDDYEKVTGRGIPSTPPDYSAPINSTNAATNQGAQQDSITQYLDPSYWFQSVDSQIADAMRGVILTILNPILQVIAGVAGITAGGSMVIIGLFLIAKDSQAGQTAGRAATGAAMLAVPELGAAEASTKYIGAKGEQTLVTQRRTKGVSVGRFQVRQPTVQTTSQRMGTKDQLRYEARGYGEAS